VQGCSAFTPTLGENGMINQIVIAAIVVLGLSTIGLGKLLIDTKAELKIAATTLVDLELKVLQTKVDQTTFQQVNSKTQTEFLKVKRDLESMKGRESTVLAKPGLVQNLINKSFKKDQLALACLTGDTSACEQ
jgi:hypothetical protein